MHYSSLPSSDKSVLRTCDRTELAIAAISLASDCAERTPDLESLRSRWSELAELIVSNPPDVEPVALKAEVVGEITESAPIAFHSEQLLNEKRQSPEAPGALLKIRHHLSMLSYLLAPRDERFMPLVSIVIPVFNSSDCVARALRSSLLQTYSNVEIIVVDDGSTDNSVEVIQRVQQMNGNCIRLLRKKNGGPGSARNHGVINSRGVFIHFLDADDELIPLAVEMKVRGLAHFCGAHLCYSPLIIVGDGELTWSLNTGQQLLDAPNSAVRDPMLATTTGFAFSPSAVMVARWFLEEVGLFETALRQSEDLRCWFRMARAGLIAVALSEPATKVYIRPSSLSCDRNAAIHCALETNLLSAVELGRSPRQWCYLVTLLKTISWLMEQALDEGVAPNKLQAFSRRLGKFETGLAARSGRGAILADQLIIMLDDLIAYRPREDRSTRKYALERAQRLRSCVASAAQISDDEIRQWLPDLPRQPHRGLGWRDRTSLDLALDQLHTSLVRGVLPVSPRALRNVGDDFLGHPYQDRWAVARRIANVLGETTTVRLARTKIAHAVGRRLWPCVRRIRRRPTHW